MNAKTFRWARWLIPAMLLIAAAVHASHQATDELLRLVPADIAACLVIEDVAEISRRAGIATMWERFNHLPLVQRWKKSESHQSFENLLAFLPVYFGVSNDQLVHDVLGESVVLAFRPGNPGEPATGLFLCRARDEAVLAKVVERIVSPNPNREVVRHSHKGVEFFERTEFGGRHDFVLRLGPVAVLSDKRQAIIQVIENSAKPGGLYDSPVFREMRAAVGDDSPIHLLVHTRPFDQLMHQAVSATSGPASAFAGLIVHGWQHLRWVALGLRLDDPLEVVLSASIDHEHLPADEKNWPALLAEPTEFWARVPENAVAAFATKADFVSLSTLLRRLSQSLPELKSLLDACCQLAVGFDVERDIVPGLGPEFGAVAILNPAGDLDVLAEIQLRPTKTVGDVGLSLPETLELLTLRPLLVFYSLDHNMMWKDETRTVTETIDGLRVHSMVNSGILPSFISPSFAVNGDRLYLASSPGALRNWRAFASTSSWSDSAKGKRFRSACGERAVPKAMLDVSRLRAFLLSREDLVAQGIATTAEADAQSVRQRLRDLSALLELVDFCTLSTSTNEDVRHWSLSIFPSRPANPR